MGSDIGDLLASLIVTSAPIIVYGAMYVREVRDRLGRLLMGFNPVLIALGTAAAPVIVDVAKKQLKERGLI
jgi:hypothetical protein